jgi:adenosylmethionine-8-amino-7-oxononanoate aminotransferase
MITQYQGCEVLDPNFGPGPSHEQELARKRLLLNFTDFGGFDDHPIPLIVRGDGCEVIDSRGHRFIDGISGLFCSNLGHGFGSEIGAAAQRQLSELVFAPSWSLTHPSAALLAERLTTIAAPLGMERLFLTSGGSESVEAAWKMVRQWHAANGEPQRTKAIARNLAYHGTSLGALSFTGLEDCREPFLPLPVPVSFVSNTNAYRHPLGHDEARFTQALLDEVHETILREGPDQVAMLIAEPIQNSGGAFVPPAGYWPGLRALCDRYGIILVADETISGFGRVGEWFASTRFDAKPDIITFAKGATAGHAPLGGVLVNARVAEPFGSGAVTYMHGLTFGGHPLTTSIALAVLDIYEREQVFENVRALEPFLGARLEQLRGNPLVGDVRGAGFFWAVELVKDRETQETFDDDEAQWLLRTELSGHMDELGLLCRLDDRGDPVIQISPPLVSDEATLDRIVSILGEATDRAHRSWSRGRSRSAKTAAVRKRASKARPQAIPA